MNKHLQLAHAYHTASGSPLAHLGASGHLTDMQIIGHQALLMDACSVVCKSLQKGDMAEILGGLTELAYAALSAAVLLGDELLERPVLWRNDGYVISLMRLLVDKVGACADGTLPRYSEVYCACAHLANNFLNADFDKAFRKVHASHLAALQQTENPAPYHTPDLSDCLFE